METPGSDLLHNINILSHLIISGGNGTRWPLSRVLCADRSQAMAIHLGGPLPARSGNLPGRRPGNRPYAFPIWFCSRWGLPCHPCYQGRGALLPHPFTLACGRSPSAVCFLWHFPGIAPGGRYPPPCFRGARTFLSRGLSTLAAAAIRPSGPAAYVRPRGLAVKSSRLQALAGQ